MIRIPSSGSWSASAHTCANTVSWPVPNSSTRRRHRAFHLAREESSHFLLRRRAALDERRKTDAMAPAVDNAALDGGLFGPANLRERALEEGAEITGIELSGRQ